MKLLAVVFLCFFFSDAFNQPSDFLSFKRKNKPIQNYYAGSQIEFTNVYGQYRNALITRIQNDTLFLKEFYVRQIPTTLGTYIYDTTGSLNFTTPYKDIFSMGAKAQKKFNVSASGSALLGGGILLLLASGVVYLADRDKFSPELAGSAAGLAAVGYLLSRSAAKPMIINKRGYSLEYVDMTP